MNCSLCEKPIENYHSTFNHLKIDEKHEIDICQNCVEKIKKWQQEIIAKLFPTKNMKKIISKQ